MVVFHQNLTAKGQDYEFHFHQILNPDGEKYFVEVLKGEMRITSFEMKQTINAWHIVPPVPEWIMELQTQLRKIIEDHVQLD